MAEGKAAGTAAGRKVGAGTIVGVDDKLVSAAPWGISTACSRRRTSVTTNRVTAILTKTNKIKGARCKVCSFKFYLN